MEAHVNESSATAATAGRKFFRVLVIDDNPVDGEITARHLGKAWPFERELIVDYAATGRDALEKMRFTRYALVALDWKLPVMGGGEVLRQMRASGIRVPVVVLSGLQRHQIPENLDELGAAFLNKDDMNPLTFHAAIAESLKRLGLVASA
jgi:two-component system chemotaxis response regulator CheY